MKIIGLLSLLLISGSAFAQVASQQTVSYNYLLTSTLLAAVTSAFVSAAISIWLKDKEYKNDYHKKIIDKRIKGIESIEAMFALINPSVFDIADATRVYPAYFRDSIGSKKFQELASAISIHSLWISRNTRNNSNNLIAVILKIEHKALKLEGVDRISFLIKESEQLVDLKVELQKSMIKDMQNMYNVNSFFKLRFYSENRFFNMFLHIKKLFKL